ncbi:MAG: cobalamin biosynthesis protein CobD [Hyphomicrobium sp.]|nr:cobalamin biosynthesis protein CobD [Sphingomonas sp.]MBA4100512.1 cobalamin biosynthesis protein CobD [Rhodospirillum sp.]MBA4172230.1 cobalamin biosynthesis protein CobD [Hyphomicrobium sp.]
MRMAVAMLVALTIDAVIGWPQALYARIGHPVTWIGAIIAALDRHINREASSDLVRRFAGILATLCVIGLAIGVGVGLTALLPRGWIGIVLTGLLAWPLVAVRSMHNHVDAVARPLIAGDLTAARLAVSMIVGRDPDRLDEAGVARAALESLAENTSDGIVAPLVWGALFGLPGIVGYKAINTLDSMIGHRTVRHEAFGWASARIDDLANLIPARLTGLVFALASDRPRLAISTMLRDAHQHRSPNAGWPEAAMAGALGVRLSGPRAYGDKVSAEPWLNGAAPDPVARDIARGLAIYRRAMVAIAIVLLLLAIV